MTVSARATSSMEVYDAVVGEWEWSDGRHVTVNEDRSADLLDAGSREKIGTGTWQWDSAKGDYVFQWEGGERHTMSISAEGDALQGMVVRGGLPTESISATRVTTGGFFGSTSPTGNVTETEFEEEEEIGAGTYKSAPTDSVFEEETEVVKTPVERTETRLILEAKDAEVSGPVSYDSGRGALGNWKGEGTVATWDIASLEPGTYTVAMEYSVGTGRNGGKFEMATGSAKSQELVRTTGSWKTFKTKQLGTIVVGEGDETLSFTATDLESGAALMNVRSVELKRK